MQFHQLDKLLKPTRHLICVSQLGYVADLHYSIENIPIIKFTPYPSKARTFAKKRAFQLASEMRDSNLYPPLAVVNSIVPFGG